MHKKAKKKKKRTKERFSDFDVVSYGNTWKGLRIVKYSEPPILDAKEKKFNSLIPSKGNTPTLPLVATYSNYGEHGDPDAYWNID